MEIKLVFHSGSVFVCASHPSTCLLLNMINRVMINFADPKIEPIPVALQDVVERLLNKNVVSTKPDSAIIDIFNEVPYDSSAFYVLIICIEVDISNLLLRFYRVITLSLISGHNGLEGLCV